MTGKAAKTERRLVRAIRGTEDRAITQWQGQGWRLISRAPGKLRTDLTFERERRPLPRKALIGGGVFVVVLAVVITIGALTERPERSPVATESAAEKTTATTSASTPTSRAPVSNAPRPVSDGAETITVANNPDFATLLKTADNCDERVVAFAHRYDGREIRFDGALTGLSPHDDAKTRYDMLVVPGKADTTIGPTFQFADVNAGNDLGWANGDAPESLAVGAKLRITATVDDYDASTCLLHLVPVATSMR